MTKRSTNQRTSSTEKAPVSDNGVSPLFQGNIQDLCPRSEAEAEAVLRWCDPDGDGPDEFIIHNRQKLARATKRKKILCAREDPNAFAEYAFEDSVSGQPLRQADIHRELQAAIHDESTSHTMIEFPRNHGKTTQVEIGVLFLLGRNPNLRFKIVCESDNKAQERVQHLAMHITHNKKLREVFPDLRPADRGSWTKKKIVVQRSRIMRDVSIEACGIQTAATGGRADYLIADDPVGRRNALEIPKLRETIKTAWHSDWLNLLEPTGRVIYIYTPWHTADLSHMLKQNPVYKIFSKAVGPHLEPVWPQKWPRQRLKAKLAEVGQREFDRGYRLVALSGDYATVRPEWITYWKQDPHLEGYLVFTAYDLSTGEGDDFFASVSVGLDLRDLGKPLPRIVVLDGWQRKLTFLSQVGAVLSEAKIWRPEAVALEAVQYQAVLPQILNAAQGSPELGQGLAAEIIPIRPRLSKALRLAAVTPLLETGRVEFNPALDPGLKHRPDLVDQLMLFPLAAHDDLVDAFVYAVALAVDYSIRAGASPVDVSSYGGGTTLTGLEEAGQALIESQMSLLGDGSEALPAAPGTALEAWAQGEE